VELISEDALPPSAQPGLPEECSLLRGPLLQRQVWLSASPSTAAAQPPLVYAASWWNAADYDATMSARASPIWRNLAARRRAVYRDLRSVSYGCAPPQLAAAFGAPQAMQCWARTYVLCAESDTPLCVIYEAFSPALQRICEGEAGTPRAAEHAR